MELHELHNTITTLRVLRDEVVDEALSGNIKRDHHLRSAVIGFELVGKYQAVIEDLEETARALTLEDLDDGPSR